MEGIFLVILFVLVAVVFRLIAGGMDRDRVGEYVASRGGQLLDKRWAPFGRGWFGEKNDRIYEIRYLDSAGNEHEATCKTSMFSGVYMTEDRIIRPAGDLTVRPSVGPAAGPLSHDPSRSREQQLAAENQRLREELERLRDQP